MPLFFLDDHYEGFINVGDRRYFISANIPSLEQWKPEHIVLDWRLNSFLNDKIYHFIQGNSNISNFTEFFHKLETFVKLSMSKASVPDLWLQDPLKACNMYKSLVEELNTVEEYIKDINFDNGTIEVEARDQASRKHQAVLKVNENYPREAIKITKHDLPLSDAYSLEKNTHFSSATTLSAFVRTFVQYIDGFHDFWNSVSILDTHCWILDPENPTFKDTTRKIKISDKISIVLIFNPYMATQRPDIKFVGCRAYVEEFREVLQKNLEKEVWDPQDDILTNLMNLLEVEFPTKPQISPKESLDLVQSGECAICFMVRLDDKLPSEICDNSLCMSQYHVLCLFKYLSSVPRNTHFLGRIQGECPNCEKVISCPVPSLS